MLTPRENFIRYFKDEPTEWMPSGLDYLQFAPEEIVENVVRGFVSQHDPFPKEKFGGRGWFGIDWVFVPVAGGSMEVAPLFENIIGWEDKVEWPNLDEVDWEAVKERNKDYLRTDKLIRPVFLPASMRGLYPSSALKTPRSPWSTRTRPSTCTGSLTAWPTST